MIRTALLSVSDKNGIVPFAKALHEQGIKLISTCLLYTSDAADE